VSFHQLGVHPALAKALARQDITEPFPIQQATLPDAIAGRDVLGRGQTGSGKTLAFGLALLTRLAGRKAKPHKPLGLVLAPTRELAMQIQDSLAPLMPAVSLRSRLIAGGMPYGKQIEALRSGVPILIATPGRLIDLMERGDVDLSATEIVVLDEADQMADMGFLPAMKRILDTCKPGGQRLLFSATLDRGVDKLVKSYLHNPVEHAVNTGQASVTTMDHHVLVVQPEDRDTVIAQIAAREGRTIIFTRTKHGADRLAKKLAQQGVPSGALHGGKTQSARTKTLDRFKDGQVATLVATNVAARGIHVDGISLVVHFDAPTDPKDYLHRAGRTARAGETGIVVTMTAPRQQRTVKTMTDQCGVKPTITRVKPMSTELVSITGAQKPDGTPWQPDTSAATKPHRSATRSRPGNRSGQRRRRPAGRTQSDRPQSDRSRASRPHKSRSKATANTR
jgi:superfamily II DNA/RNA helicase